MRFAVHFLLLLLGLPFSASAELTLAHTTTRPSQPSYSLLASVSASTSLQIDPAALKCWLSWDKWLTSSANCAQATTTVFPASGSPLSKYTTTIFKTFKLCDGHPRARVTGGDRTSLSAILLPGASSSITQTLINPPQGIPLSTITAIDTSRASVIMSSCIRTPATPTCAILDTACAALASSWTAGNFSRIKPPCTEPVPKNPCDQCIMSIPSVRLMYFPVTMTGNFCGNYSTVLFDPAMQSRTTSTIEISGTTFTSSLAYLSYAGITAQGPSGSLCGPTKPAGILALPSSDIFSLRGLDPAQAIAGNTHWPFNFADLAPNPVPWPAWISQATCAGHESQPQCQTITQAAYRPGLVYPSAFQQMQPEWAKCITGVFGIVDPPTALSVATDLAKPTAPGSSITSHRHSSAAPQVTPKPGKPTSTTYATSILSVPASTRDRSRTRITSTQTLAPSAITSSALELTTRSKDVSRQPTDEVGPAVELTFADQIFTAYSEGAIVGPSVTLLMPKHQALTLDDNALSLASNGVWLDGTMHSYRTTRTDTASPSMLATSSTMHTTLSSFLPSILSASTTVTTQHALPKTRLTSTTGGESTATVRSDAPRLKTRCSYIAAMWPALAMVLYYIYP